MKQFSAFIVLALIFSVLFSGCSKQPKAPKNSVDVEAAKKAGLPLVIYGVSTFKDSKTGQVHPVINFANTSDKLISVVIYELEAKAEGTTMAHWVEDYEHVSPGSVNAKPVLNGGWGDTEVECFSIRKLDVEVDGKTVRYFDDNIKQLVQEASLTTCSK